MEAITTVEAAEILEVTRARVIQMAREGKLNFRRFGRAFMLDRAAVVAMRERPGPGRPPKNPPADPPPKRGRGRPRKGKP